MRPLTLHTPKPLLAVDGRPLIDYHLANLANAGVRDVVINVSWLGQQIIDYCGDGSRWGVQLWYSQESEPLETAGGIVRALPLLGDEPFIVISADVWTDFPLASLVAQSPRSAEALLIMVDSPAHNTNGDFSLGDSASAEPDGTQCSRPLELAGEQALTFSGVGLYHPAFFSGVPPGKGALRPLFEKAIGERRLWGAHYPGSWTDVGTPQRLAELELALDSQSGTES